jgi:hypothetical protein
MLRASTRYHLFHLERLVRMLTGAIAALLITALVLMTSIAASGRELPSFASGTSETLAPDIAPDELPGELRWERKAVTFDGMIRDSGRRPSLDWIRERR